MDVKQLIKKLTEYPMDMKVTIGVTSGAVEIASRLYRIEAFRSERNKKIFSLHRKTTNQTYEPTTLLVIE